MQRANRGGKVQPRFQSGWALVACQLCAAAFCYAAPLQQQTSDAAPFYQSLRLRPGLAQSMVYGPGTIEGGSFPQRPPTMSRPTPTAQCQRPPETADYRNFSGLEHATAAQAKDLGLVLRTRSGDSQPFRTGEIVLLRSGKYAHCLDNAQTRTLIYGAEWIVGFRLEASPGSLPRTMSELASTIRQGKLVEFGYVVQGGAQGGVLEDELRSLADAWQNNESLLITRLEAARAAWPASRLQVDAVVPLGIVKP